jgi:hypothetical protein
LILEAATKQSLMFQLITCAEQNMTFLDQNKTEQEEETRHSSQKKHANVAPADIVGRVQVVEYLPSKKEKRTEKKQRKKKS